MAVKIKKTQNLEIPSTLINAVVKLDAVLLPPSDGFKFQHKTPDKIYFSKTKLVKFYAQIKAGKIKSVSEIKMGYYSGHKNQCPRKVTNIKRLKTIYKGLYVRKGITYVVHLPITDDLITGKWTAVKRIK